MFWYFPLELRTKTACRSNFCNSIPNWMHFFNLYLNMLCNFHTFFIILNLCIDPVVSLFHFFLTYLTVFLPYLYKFTNRENFKYEKCSNFFPHPQVIHISFTQKLPIFTVIHRVMHIIHIFTLENYDFSTAIFQTYVLFISTFFDIL